MATSYRDYLVNHLAPTWLRRTWGARFMGVLGDVADRVISGAKQAVKVGFHETAPSDALPYIGVGHNLERYFADADADYRARIADAWNVWEFAATDAALDARLDAIGLPTASIVPWYQTGGFAADPYSAWYSAFWVIVHQLHPFTRDLTWGDPGTWDDTVSGHNGAPPGPGTWDSDATSYEVNEIRSAIKKWKGAHEICASIIFVDSGGDVYEDSVPWDSGTWDDTVTFQWSGV